MDDQIKYAYRMLNEDLGYRVLGLAIGIMIFAGLYYARKHYEKKHSDI